MTKKSIFLILGLAVIAVALFIWKGSRSPLSLSSIPETTENIGVVSSGALPLKTEAAKPVAPSVATNLSPDDQKKYSVLMQIFASRNDNDPRFDTDLKQLSPELKAAFEKYYHQTAAEKRNERGTVVFLIARSVENQGDIDFLKSVLNEPPCLSLADCSKAAPPATGEQAHLDGLNAITASYPQLTAVRQSVEAYQRLSQGDAQNPEIAGSLLEMVREAEQSPNPRVAQEARTALQNLKN
jgi:hypothetical protein